MKKIFFFFLIGTMILISSCNNSKQKETQIIKTDTLVKEQVPVVPVIDTIASTTNTAPAKADTIAITTGGPEISVSEMATGSKSIPPFKTTGIYLRFRKDSKNSVLFIGPANEWGVININGKVEKLKFVKGYEDEATYANADYDLSYDLNYLTAPQEENPIVPGTITIKRKGYKTYKNKIWGVWGID